jgi:MFS family permease
MTTAAEPAGTGRSAVADGDVSGSLRQRLLVPVLVLSGSLMALVSSLGAPLVPTLARADGVSLSTGEWILTATLLTGAVVTPVMGRLADGPRQREISLAALGAVVLGCVLSAVSNGFTMLVIGRALQGAGLGVLPVTMAIARRNLPPEESRRTIALLSITAAIGAGLGYPLTALIAQVLDFRAAYWFGAITVTGTLVLSALVLPPRSAGLSRRLDVVGSSLLSLAVIGISVVLSEGGGWGWSSGRSVGIAAVSVALFAVWIPFELRVADPLVDLRQVRNRSVLTADISGFLIGIAFYLLVPVIVEFVQIPRSAGYGFGASLVISGLVLTPLSVGSFGVSRVLVGYERRFGPRTMIPLGSLVTAAAAIFFAVEHSALWEAFFAFGVIGMGVGFTLGAMPGFIVRSVALTETGSAMGFFQVVRALGVTVGSALSAAVLMAHTPHGEALPNGDGFTVALFLAGGLCLATAVVSFVLPGRALSGSGTLTARDEKELELRMKDEAELVGTGLILAEEPLPFGQQEDPAAQGR